MGISGLDVLSFCASLSRREATNVIFDWVRPCDVKCLDSTIEGVCVKSCCVFVVVCLVFVFAFCSGGYVFRLCLMF